MNGLYIDLGLAEYGAALELQRSLVARRVRGEIPDVLILLEHNHVITLGRKTSAGNLKEQSIPVFQVERGGDATYHGPGQLVGYPITMLEDHDVRRHVRNMEDAIIGAVRDFGIEAAHLDGRPGVWVKGKKLASVGVAVTDWVAYHGFALNVNTELSYFELIRPCGFEPGVMTSMERIKGVKLPFEQVKEDVLGEIARVTGNEYVPWANGGTSMAGLADKH